MREVRRTVNVEGGTVLVDNAPIAGKAPIPEQIDDRPRDGIGRSAGKAGRMIGVMLCVLTLMAAGSPLARAQGGINLVRDAEIEAALRDITNPILDAAGVSPELVNLYIVRDKRLNAFVAGGTNLFLNTGLLMRTEHPGQLAGTIAHEVGHIAGGHLSRVATAQSRAAAEVILSTVLGAAAAVAGAPALGTAIIAGGQTVAQGDYLSFSRSQEQAADQAAISYLRRVGISPAGLGEFFHILDEQNLLSTSRGNPYLRSHPLTGDRIRFVETQVEQTSQKGHGYPEAWDIRHRRMVVKLQAFLDDPRRTLQQYQGDGLADRYARAIAHYRLPALNQAIAEIDELISDYPDDPYFQELKGQMLFENGRIEAAVEPYERAVELSPTVLMRIGLARALIETGEPAAGTEAISQLEVAVRGEPNNAQAWRLLGIAQGRAGEEGVASLSLAEWALLTGKHDDAKLHVKRAENRIGPSDSGWLQLQDILLAIEEIEQS